MTENVIIIGGGPAGLSAAIYLARADLNPLLFAGSPPGGQLTLTSEVENYPGFESILGSDLIEKMRNQAKKFGTRIVDENALKVDFSKRPFEIMGSIPKFFDGKQQTAKNLVSSSITSKSIIIATGAKALWLNLPSETRLRGHGVSACATCDGFFFREKTVAVVGGGDTALEEALTLTKFAKKVYIIHRRDFFRASKIMQERVLKNKKIETIWNAAVEEIMGEKKVEGIRIKFEARNPRSEINSKRFENSNLKNSDLFRDSRFELRTLKLDGVFIAIGHKPDTDLFKDKVELDEKGYVMTSVRKALEEVKSQKLKVKNESQNLKVFNFDFQTMTSVSGIFSAGDCADHIYKQAATSVGTGVAAALEVERYLESLM